MNEADASTRGAAVEETDAMTGDSTIGSKSGTVQPSLDPMSLEPTQAEIDEWAEKERRRREAWLKGPSPDERQAYARRVRERRLVEIEGGDDPWSEWGRQMRRYPREVQLAMEGAMSLFLRWSRRSYEELQKAGRDWESEFSNPIRRKRVPLDDDQP